MTIERIDGMRSRDVYALYCRWSMEDNDSAPMAIGQFVQGLKSHCRLLSVCLRDRDNGRNAKFIVTKGLYDEHRQNRAVKPSPEKNVGWNTYCELSRQRIEAFLEHPKDTWDGWTYPELYDLYYKTYNDGYTVPLPYSRFKYLFSRMWSERGGTSVPVSREGRTVRVLRSPQSMTSETSAS